MRHWARLPAPEYKQNYIMEKRVALGFSLPRRAQFAQAGYQPAQVANLPY
jgi:hypothetical protein